MGPSDQGGRRQRRLIKDRRVDGDKITSLQERKPYLLTFEGNRVDHRMGLEA